MDDAAILMNPYEILEIKPGASSEEIKAAYHRLAKVWHPDRYTGAEKETAEKRFRELAEAFNTLKDSTRRNLPSPPAPAAPAAEARPAKPGPKPPAAERLPEDWFKEAQEARGTGDLERAIGLVQVALRGHADNPEYHLFYAEVLVEAGRDHRQAVKAYEVVLRHKPNHVEALLGLAGLYQSLGMTQRSARLLQTAREIAPHHKAFRKAAQPKAKAAPPPEGLGDQVKSLFSKLFHRG